jgi:hypothetical protein
MRRRVDWGEEQGRFQAENIANADITVEFGESLSAKLWLKATSPQPQLEVRALHCSAPASPYLMRVMSFGDQTVEASHRHAGAFVELRHSDGLCKAGSSPPDYGYVKGQWTTMDFSDTSDPNYTGNFRWLDFYPDATTPGCPGGGAQELACLIAGTGQCSLPAPTAGGCDKAGGVVPRMRWPRSNVGSLSGGRPRFGVYKGGGGERQHLAAGLHGLG